MSKTKIITGSLIIGFISGFISVYVMQQFSTVLPGLIFGVAILLSLKLLLKNEDLNISKILMALFASAVSYYIALMVTMFLVATFNFNIIISMAIGGFVGFSVFIFPYEYIFKINFSKFKKLKLIILSSILSLTGLIPFPIDSSTEGVYVPSFYVLWQTIMLGALIYATAQTEENKKPEQPLFLRKE
jgi:hypothetical protein